MVLWWTPLNPFGSKDDSPLSWHMPIITLRRTKNGWEPVKTVSISSRNIVLIRTDVCSSRWQRQASLYVNAVTYSPRLSRRSLWLTMHWHQATKAMLRRPWTYSSKYYTIRIPRDYWSLNFVKVSWRKAILSAWYWSIRRHASVRP